MLLLMLCILAATPPQLQHARLLLPPLPHQQRPLPLPPVHTTASPAAAPDGTPSHWHGWGGGAGRRTVASSACSAGDHAAAAAPSCAHTPSKLARALMFSSGAVCQRRVRVAICTSCIHCRVHTLACVAHVCRSLQPSAFMLQPPPRRGRRELARVAISSKTYEPGAHVGCSLWCSCSSKRCDRRVMALLAGNGDGGHAFPDEGTG